MVFGPLRGLVQDLSFDVHGVAATVTPRHGSPIVTTLIWVAFDPPDSEFKDLPRRAAVLRKSEVPQLFRGDHIEAPERIGETARAWMVDMFTDGSDGLHRVIVQAGEPRE